MYKVLLADDEPAALEALRLAADWENLGYVICGECSNGEEAVRLFESLRPDLVVTDVRMPAMDGLDFVRHIVEFMRSNAEFILVSGYDEFEYAKRAIKYGIRHYVLKPVIKEEFTEVLAKVAARLRQRDRLKELDVWNGDVEAYEYFERLISGACEEFPTAAGKSAPAGTDHGNAGGEYPNGSRTPEAGENDLWAYAIIKPYVYRASAPESSNGIHISCSDLKNELERSENPYMIAHVAPLEKEGYSLVLRCSNKDSSENDGASLANAAEALRANFARVFSHGFYLAVSSPADSPVLLKKLSKEAIAALNFSFFRPAGSILYYEECGLYRLNYSLDRIEDRDDIYESLENIDMERLTSSVVKVFDAFARTFTAPEVVEIYLTNVIYKGLELIKGMGGDIGETVKNYPGGMLNFSGLSLNEAKNNFECYCKDVIETLCRLKSAERQSDMLKVKDYISRHYKSAITIREISGNIFIHPVYLGHLIHKWFGCSFNEYVNRLRIDEAKQLLADKDRKVGDIAAEVGYGEYCTFLKQFEKYVGMKPVEYRDICS